MLGHHEGIHNFTVGQRKGLGVATGSPLYVININGSKGQVTVGNAEELLATRLLAHRMNWIAFDELREPVRVQAKIRHRHEPAPPPLRLHQMARHWSPLTLHSARSRPDRPLSFIKMT